MSGRLAGRVAIVTGGGKGLGRTFALDLAAAGAHVVVNNRDRTKDAAGRGPAEVVVEEIRATGGTAVAENSDVTDPGAARSMLDTALNAYGRVDFLVTSAAVSAPAMFHKSTPEQFDAVIATNLGGTAHIAALCSKHMREAGFGRIVFVSSTAGLHGEPTASAYTASKGALIALGRAIAVEGERRNVLTNIVLPYATTQMTETGMPSEHHDAFPPDVVAPVVTALVDPESTLNGQVLVAAGGGLRVASTVEWGTVALPGTSITPGELTDLIAHSRQARPREFREAQAAFEDFAASLPHHQMPVAPRVG
ncbi:MAG: SDR family NAD(P)-dependent oxidoreductase [Kibdelosporangium sp.]